MHNTNVIKPINLIDCESLNILIHCAEIKIEIKKKTNNLMISYASLSTNSKEVMLISQIANNVVEVFAVYCINFDASVLLFRENDRSNKNVPVTKSSILNNCGVMDMPTIFLNKLFSIGKMSSLIIFFNFLRSILNKLL